MPGILLGSIQFVDREVPDTVNWGGKQVLAIHRLMGGTRVIDALGPDPHPITWSGLFLGPDASARARAVDAMRKSGAEVQLNWGSFSYLVVVSDFKSTYKHEWEVRYSIAVEVVDDLAANVSSIPLSTIVASDIAAITTIATAAPAIPAVSGATSVTPAMNTGITNLNTAITNATSNQTSTSPTVSGAVIATSVSSSGALDNLSLSQMQPVLNAAQDANATFAAGNGSPIGINLDAQTATSVLDGINAFASEVNAVAIQSDVMTATAFMGRIVGNLSSMGG